MKKIFNVSERAQEVIGVLEKHGATVADMKEVFKLVKKDVLLRSVIHKEDLHSFTQ